MFQNKSFCIQPFKFVVVGDIESGKTTLINRLLSDFRGNDPGRDSDSTKSTFICNDQTIILNATVKYVRKDGSSIALKDCDISRQLWHKKFSTKKLIPQKFHLLPEYQNDISWDDIFVYLHKPSRVENRLFFETISHCCHYKVVNGDENIPLKVPPEKPARSYLYTRRPDGKIETYEERKRATNNGRESRRKSESTEIIVDIWDTKGDKSLDWHQWYACTGADAVLLCIPLRFLLHVDEIKQGKRSRRSAGNENEIVKSLEEILPAGFISDKTKRRDHKVPPVLLVGTKSDECEIVNRQRRSVFEMGEERAIDTIGLNLAAEIGCCDFVYCSGLRGNGVASVFEAALAVSFTMDDKYRASYRRYSNEFDSEMSDCESSLSREEASPTYFKVHTFPKSEKNTVGSTNDEHSLQPSYMERKGVETERPPPRLYFPPPPESSPPSTRPNSSNSSHDHSESIGSSSDSSTDFSFNWSHDSESQRSQVFESSISVDSSQITPCAAIQTPTPSPRKTILCDRSESISSFVDSAAKVETLPENSNPSFAPIPKPRRHRKPPKPKDQKVERNRRETVFVKFLKAN